MLKLARRARGHFVTLIEICVHLIRVKPGHIWQNRYRTHRSVIHAISVLSVKCTVEFKLLPKLIFLW